ncbi:DsrE family protein [Roseivirga sp.]|uniref:DsrE family protein n=1 Tax=Roseivirga sp. TaxID=1964215 RepID=UPI002B270B2C|nr:DsrE family protein [Roseivirga sp.]
MKKISFLLICFLFPTLLLAQLPEYLEGKMTYPVFDFNPMVGVVKTQAKALNYNKDLEYKIAIDVTDKVYDSTQVMSTLNEVARTYNLNIANGVPKKKLKVAVVIHGSAIQGILNDEAYQAKFGVPNPNIAVIKEMKKEGIEFYVCAQVLAFRQVPEENVMKDIDLAISAKTALITLDQMGYTYMSVNN